MSEAEPQGESEQADDLFGRWLTHHADQAAGGPRPPASDDMTRQTPDFEPVITPSTRKRSEEGDQPRRGFLRKTHRAPGPALVAPAEDQVPTHAASGPVVGPVVGPVHGTGAGPVPGTGASTVASTVAGTGSTPPPPPPVRRTARSTSGEAPDWLKQLRGEDVATPAPAWTPADNVIDPAVADEEALPDWMLALQDEVEVEAEVEAEAEVEETVGPVVATDDVRDEIPVPLDEPEWKTLFRRAVDRDESATDLPDVRPGPDAEPVPQPEPEPASAQVPEPAPEPEPEAAVAPVPPREPEATPEPAATAEPVAAVEPEPEPERDPARVDPVHVFRPRSGVRHLVTAVLVAGIVATVYLCHAVYVAPDHTGIPVAAVAAFATAVVWAVRASSTVTRMTVRGGQLEVRRDAARRTFDLTSEHTSVALVGTPGRRGWKATVTRSGTAPLVLTSSVVDPGEFVRVLHHYRPREAQSEAPAEIQ